MPTYDYVCNGCRHEFEKFQSMSDDVLKTCPDCGKDEVVRKISGGTGVIFKGSGFYKTDYADKKETKPAEPKANKSCCSGGCGCGH